MRRWVLLVAGVAVVLASGFAVVSRAFTVVTRGYEDWTQRPRVFVGGDAFETVAVTDRENVRMTGELDGEPGDDLAIIDYGRVQILTAATLAERQRFELDGSARSTWRPSSRLARIGTDIVIVDSGGAVDDARVRDLDGTQRWLYRPDVNVPATSLEPADLDGDGRTEFYATITSFVVRLDASGGELWRSPFPAGRIVATAPRTQRDPAWIVAQGQGETVVWDSDGSRLGGVTMKDAQPLGVIDRPDGRFVLAGGSALRAVGLDGRVMFDWAIDGMQVIDAEPLMLQAGAAPAVALLASGPRPTTRWRLQIVSPDRRLLYDELLDEPAELLRARGADQVDRLFLNGAGLFMLRPRRGSA